MSAKKGSYVVILFYECVLCCFRFKSILVSTNCFFYRGVIVQYQRSRCFQQTVDKISNTIPFVCSFMMLESYPFTISIILRINWIHNRTKCVKAKAHIRFGKGAKTGYLSGLLHFLFHTQPYASNISNT